MKKITLFLLCAVMSATGLFAITKTVGTTGADYATLGAAFTDINSATNGMTGTIELQIIDDIDQAGPAIISRDGVIVLIYPTVTGKTISMASVAGATIQINGADNITIDGRLRNSSGVITGNTPDLTIVNTFTTAAATNNTIGIAKGASTLATNNTITYCNIKGSNTNVVYINNNTGGNTTATNNVISYNKFTPSTVRPTTVISIQKGEHTALISRNNFENVVGANGINAVNEMVNSEVSYNSFYETVSFTPTVARTYINFSGSSGSETNTMKNNLIANNFIGGSGPECSGTMQKNEAADNFTFVGISLTQSANNNTIKNNSIKNITWNVHHATNASASSFTGIKVSGLSFASFSNTIDGNYIGGITYWNNNAADKTGTLIGIDKGQSTGIAGIAIISNNIISLGDDYPNTIRGIREFAGNSSAALASTSVYNNTVYISGTPTAGNAISYCLTSTHNTNTRDFRNNIFVNTRSGGSGKHYGSYITVTGGTITSDYNNYYVTGTTGYSGYYGADIAKTLYVVVTDQDVYSSVATPGITPGTTPESFKGTALLAGVAIAGVTTDFTGNTRSSSPLMGAYESSLWNGSSWVGGEPTEFTSAVINGDFTTGGFNCLDLIVNPAKQVTISTPSSVAGNLTLKSDAANGTATIIDDATLTVGANKTFVEQSLTNGRQWWYLSSPLSEATSNVISPVASPHLMGHYTEATTSYSAPFDAGSGTALTAGKGYVVKFATTPRTITFTGGLLNTGTIPATVTRTGTDAPKRGFNLIGNPYPSYIDWDALHGDTETLNMRDAVWFRTYDSGMKFHTYGDADGVPEVTSSKIAPMQAFWVKVAADGSNGTLKFKNTHRSHFIEGANPLKVKAADLRPRLRLVVSNGTASDEMLIVGKSYATNLLDSYDIEKMSASSASIPEIYSLVQNEEIVINSLKELTDGNMVNLGFRPGQAGNYTLEVTQLDNIDAKVVLVDKTANTQTELVSGTSYTFTTDATVANSRFSVEFRAPGALTSVNNPITNASVWVNADNRIAVQAAGLTSTDRISVYTMAGQQILTQQATGTVTVLNQPFTAGVYIVKVNHLTQKVVVQ